jgi:hypothetical protein
VSDNGIAPAPAAAGRARHFARPRWGVLTAAVARGLAATYRHRVGPARGVKPPPVHGWQVILFAVLTYVLLRPLVGLGHELSVCGAAALLHTLVGTDIWQPVVDWLGLDPIYTGAAVRAAGGVEIDGLAVAGPIGDWLHALLPALILAPDRVARAAGISMVAATGAPALGRGLASFGADLLWLIGGVWLVKGWHGRPVGVALMGLLIQGQIVVNHLLDAHLSIADLEASGLPFALAVAAPGGSWFSQDLKHMPELLRTLVVGGTLVALAYGCAAIVLLVGRGVWRVAHLCARSRVDRARANPPLGRQIVLAGTAVALVTAISPIGALAFGSPNWAGMPTPPSASLRPASRPGDLARPQTAPGPSRVKIEQAPDGNWQCLVNGQPRVIRGVGYNPQYAALTADDRARVYQRDFSAMHQLGINTIEGWFEPQFDQLTLEYAARNDIGVLMPFELNQDWPYENPNVQQSILDHVSAYVERYKNDPAVRMWAPGNEDLHRILYPHMKTLENEPAVRARADAFAAFLPVLVDRIHQLDPNHPVIYRDAEDVYLPRLKQSFEATGVARPWLVYGANVYTQARLQQIVTNWPSQWLDGPLIISEFAPGGVGPAERPVGFQQDWAVIRSRPGIVLGGLAYTWATNGPEDLDRVFGLVDPQAVPTDGALAALSASYLTDNQQTASAASPG